MKDYQKGYESIPGSTLDEDQKKTWLGRLHHGKARTLARMGKHEEAWAEVETIKKMIEDGGEAGGSTGPRTTTSRATRSSRPATTPRPPEHLDAGEQERSLPHAAARACVREARAQGRGEAGLPAGRSIRSAAGIERPLAYPEAKRKIQASLIKQGGAAPRPLEPPAATRE